MDQTETDVYAGPRRSLGGDLLRLLGLLLGLLVRIFSILTATSQPVLLFASVAY